MTTQVKAGQYVHVVATINVETGEGNIRYVNPATVALASDAVPDAAVEIVAADAAGKELFRGPVVVRRSSPEPDRSDAVGLIQADIPSMAGMQSVALLFNGKQVDRYEGGVMPDEAPVSGMKLGLQPSVAGAHKQQLTIGQLGAVPPAPGVTYTVQVKPEGAGPWNTVAVGRPTPNVEIDRNQFPGAKKAEVRVLKTTGFQEEVIADEMIELF